VSLKVKSTLHNLHYLLIINITVAVMVIMSCNPRTTQNYVSEMLIVMFIISQQKYQVLNSRDVTTFVRLAV
jgi:hypothetical protein